MFKLVVTRHSPSNRCPNGHAPQYLAPFTASHCPATDISVPLSEIYCTHHVTDSARIRPPGFCRCWSVRLEQSSGPCPQSELHRSCFQAPAKDIFVHAILVHLAHYGRRWGRFAGDALYNTLTLTVWLPLTSSFLLEYSLIPEVL